MPSLVPLNTSGIDLTQGMNAIYQGNQNNLRNSLVLKEMKDEDTFKNALSGYSQAQDPQSKQNALQQMYKVNPEKTQHVIQQEQQQQVFQQRQQQEMMQDVVGTLATVDPNDAQQYNETAQFVLQKYPGLKGKFPQLETYNAMTTPKIIGQFRQQMQGLPKPMSEYEREKVKMEQTPQTLYERQPGGGYSATQKLPYGSVLAPDQKPPEGTTHTEFDTVKRGVIDKFQQENGRPPTPAETLDLISQHKQDQKVNEASAIQEAKEKNISIPSLAKAMGEGDLASWQLTGSLGNPLRAKVQSEVRKEYPKFDFVKADANAKWDQNPGNLRTQSMIQAALPRVQALQGQVEQLGNTQIPLINRVQAFTSREKGSPEYTNFAANRNAIVQEINTALSGSATSSDMRINLELQNIAEARSPAQLHGAINNLNEALLSRMDSSKSPPWPIEVVQGKQSPSDYTKELVKQYRGNYTYGTGVGAKSGTKAPSTLPQEALDQLNRLPPGKAIKDSETGKIWMLKDGKPIEVGGE